MSCRILTLTRSRVFHIFLLLQVSQLYTPFSASCGATQHVEANNVDHRLVWAFSTDDLLQLSGSTKRNVRLRRSEDGLSFYVVAPLPNGCTAYVVSNGKPPYAVRFPYEDVFLSDEHEIVCWQEDGDFFFTNGAVIKKPEQTWDDISSEVEMTRGGTYYLRNGTVVDFRQYPHFSLWVSPSRHYCLYLVGDRATVYEVGESSNREVLKLNDFYAGGARVSTVFGDGSDLYVTGFKRSQMRDGPRCWHYKRNSSEEYVLLQEKLLEGMHSVVDVDQASQSILGMKWSDAFCNELVFFSLIDGKSSLIERCVEGGLYINPALWSKINRGYWSQPESTDENRKE